MLIKLNLIQALLGALTLIGAANGATVPKEKVSLGYYPSWFYDKFSVTDVAWKAYTHVSWAFAFVCSICPSNRSHFLQRDRPRCKGVPRR